MNLKYKIQKSIFKNISKLKFIHKKLLKFFMHYYFIFNLNFNVLNSIQIKFYKPYKFLNLNLKNMILIW